MGVTDMDRVRRPVRVTCLIDSLTAGGAQRQMSLLAVLLKRAGYDVDVLTYQPLRFFDAEVEAAGVPVRRVITGKWRRPVALRRAIRERDPHAVIAYLRGSSVYAELAGLPSRRFALIVSERTGVHGVSPGDRVRFRMHRLADAVVTNSEHGARFLIRNAPWLAGKVEVIVNGVDLECFRPVEETVADIGVTRVLVLASYGPAKNPLGMLAAMVWLRRNAPRAQIVLDWYGRTHFIDGRPGPLSRRYLELQQRVRDQGLAETFRLHDAEQDAAALYRNASLVCLPSHWEGCSNVVCEALASGVPVVASDVGDNCKLVIDGETGFLCDPNVPRTIAEAILRIHHMATDEKRTMERRARAHAEALLSPERLATSYAALIERLVPQQPPEREFPDLSKRIR